MTFSIKKKIFLLLGAFVVLSGLACGPLTLRWPKLTLSEEKPAPFKTLFSVGGPVRSIQAADNWRFMAVLSEDLFFDPTNKVNRKHCRLDLFNLEFETVYPLPEEMGPKINSPHSVAFSRDGNELLIVEQTGEGQNIRRVSLKRGKIQSETVLPPNPERDRIVLSPHGDWIACRESGRWNLIDRNEPKRTVIFGRKGESALVGAPEQSVADVLAFSPDGDFAATAMTDESLAPAERLIAVWDLKTARSINPDQAKRLPLEAILISTFVVPEINSDELCRFSNDGRMIAVACKERYIGLWQTANGRLLTEFGEHRQPVTALEFSPSNTKLAVGVGESDARIVLWEVRKGRILRSFDDPDPQAQRIESLAFSPDGNLIWYGNERGDIKTWHAQKELKSEVTKK